MGEYPVQAAQEVQPVRQVLRELRADDMDAVQLQRDLRQVLPVAGL
ncbi:MAG TPA: hypothetical protein VFG50_10570 [Rhodothermales bacterium]|nr:hypothetical protein [Rhodothermales bacterium]